MAREDGVSLVGFYMANAGGRLVGTMLSGWIFQAYGLSLCLGYLPCSLRFSRYCHNDKHQKRNIWLSRGHLGID